MKSNRGGMAALAHHRHHQNAAAIAASPAPLQAIPAVHVHAVIEAALVRRAQHVAAIEAIDRELTRAYETLATDRRTRIPAAPTPRNARARRLRAEQRLLPKWPKGATCDADVLKAVEWGLTKPRQLAARLDWGPRAIRAACMRLVAAGALVTKGHTWTLHYERPAKQPTTRAANTRVIDGVEYEVWSPSKDAPSLLGARDTKGSIL